MESGRRIWRKRGSSPLTQNPAAVRAARENANRKQQDVAEEIGISPSLLSEIENGSRSAQPHVLDALALIYGVDVDDLRHKPGDCNCPCHTTESA